MIEDKFYIVDSKQSSSIFFKKKLQETFCEYLENITEISKVQDGKVIFIVNDYKDCINLFNHRDLRKNIIIASFERDIIKILKNNKSYSDVIDLKKTNFASYIKSKNENRYT